MACVGLYLRCSLMRRQYKPLLFQDKLNPLQSRNSVATIADMVGSRRSERAVGKQRGLSVECPVGFSRTVDARSTREPAYGVRQATRASGKVARFRRKRGLCVDNAGVKCEWPLP